MPERREFLRVVGGALAAVGVARYLPVGATPAAPAMFPAAPGVSQMFKVGDVITLASTYNVAEDVTKYNQQFVVIADYEAGAPCVWTRPVEGGPMNLIHRQLVSHA